MYLFLWYAPNYFLLSHILPKRKDIYCFSDLVSWYGREVKWVTNLDHALPLSYFCIRGRFLLKSQRFWSQIYRANTNWICRSSSPLPNQTHFLGCAAAVAVQLMDPCFSAVVLLSCCLVVFSCLGFQANRSHRGRCCRRHLRQVWPPYQCDALPLPLPLMLMFVVDFYLLKQFDFTY